MSRGSKNKKLFLWLILAATIILIIISQTAFAVGERDLEQAMQSYSAGQYKEAVPQFEKAATLGNNLSLIHIFPLSRPSGTAYITDSPTWLSPVSFRKSA